MARIPLWFLLLVIVLLDAAAALAPFNLTAEIQSESEFILRSWMKQGSRSRLNLRLTYSSELGLPQEAESCNNNVGMM